MKLKACRKKSEKKEPRVFDTTVKYLCPMLPIGKLPLKENGELVECELHQSRKYDVVLSSPGYKNATFYDTYFEWLLFTGYIKKVEKE